MAVWKVFDSEFDTMYRPYECYYNTREDVRALLFGEIDVYELKNSCTLYARLPMIVRILDEYRVAYDRFMDDNGIENDIDLDNARKRLRDGLGGGKKETYIYRITRIPYNDGAHFPEDLDFKYRTREYAKLINRLTFNSAKHNKAKVIKALDEIEALCFKYLNHVNNTIKKYSPSTWTEYYRSLR